ncbi:MAG: hypothetical protein AAF449_13110 [Myxococcota bacterium]
MGDSEAEALVDAKSVNLINLDHPRYGFWLRLAGATLFLAAAGISLLFIDLVKRMSLTVGSDAIDAALPFVLGMSLGWTIYGAAIGIGVDIVRAQQQDAPGYRNSWWRRRRNRRPQSNGQKVQLAILVLGIIVAGVRVAKTTEAQEVSRRSILAAAQKNYEVRLDEWQASADGQEYIKAKAQVHRLRTLGAQLLDDGRRLSHPKKRVDGASLLAAAAAVDIAQLERTMPQPPDPSIVVPSLPWWKFANIVIWPALLEFIATELLVLSVAFWASHAFAPLPIARSSDGVNQGESEESGPHIYLLPEPVNPVFACVDVEALNAAAAEDPESPGSIAWQAAKQGLDFEEATLAWSSNHGGESMDQTHRDQA